MTLEIKDFIVTVILYTKTAIKLNVILGQATDIFIDIITSAFEATEVIPNSNDKCILVMCNSVLYFGVQNFYNFSNTEKVDLIEKLNVMSKP